MLKLDHSYEKVRRKFDLALLLRLLEGWQNLTWPAVLVGVFVLGIFLRLYRLELLAWIPDSYIQLEDASRIVNGQRPIGVAPPGIAVLMAPFFVIFPDTLLTMQLVIAGCGVGLIGVAYVAMYRLTRDRPSTFLFVLSAAIAPMFAMYSRQVMFDVVVTLFAATALFGVPYIRKNGLVVVALYGVLLAVLVNIRMTNALVLPAIAIYWLRLADQDVDLGTAIRAAFIPKIAVIGGSVIALMLASVLLGNWFENAKSVPLTTEQLIENTGYYIGVVTFFPVGAPFAVPLAVAGVRRLWRLNRSLCVAIILILVLWPVGHAPLPFTSFRYMLPAIFFMFFLMSLGVRELCQSGLRRKGTFRILYRGYTALAVACLVAYFMAGTTFVIYRWPERAALSSEGMFRETRPVLASLKSDSLVVSAVALGIRSSDNRHERLDLIYQYLSHGNDAQSVDAVGGRIDRALRDGRDVYYLHTNWDEGHDFLGDEGRLGFERYFESISKDYQTHEIFRTSQEHYWILYRVCLPASC